MSNFLIYAVILADNVSWFLCVFGFISCAVTAITLTASEGEILNSGKGLVFILISGLIGLSFFSTGLIMPNSKQMAAIVILPKVINNTQVQQLPNKLVELADSWLNELKPKIEKESAE